MPWPCDSDGLCNATVNLFQVIGLVNASTSATPAQKQGVITKAVACSQHQKMQAGTTWDTTQKHCAFVTAALGHANMGSWALCMDALDHIGTGGGGGGKSGGKKAPPRH